MQKVFIFDFDGVIINNETLWEKEKKKFYPELLGEEVARTLVSTIGLTLDATYKKAIQSGATISKEKFLGAFYKRAIGIYQTAPITPKLAQLNDQLIQL